jgi:hypothetical protein
VAVAEPLDALWRRIPCTGMSVAMALERTIL